MSITRINSLGITDGTIVNADINASAGIASTKLSGVTSEVKVWVNFIGTGTVSIRDDLNVSSITDHGTGDYSVNFTNALADANYSVAGIIREDTADGGSNPTNRVLGIRRTSTSVGTTAVRLSVANFSGAFSDVESVHVSIFR